MQLALHPAKDLHPNTIEFLMKLKNVRNQHVQLLVYLLPSCVEILNFTTTLVRVEEISNTDIPQAYKSKTGKF